MRFIKDKKRAADVLLALLVLSGTLSLAWLGLRTPKELPAMARINPESDPIPEDAFAVVIDAGHGGSDGGASGTETGVKESELNLIAAKLVSDKLTARGFYIIMTRTGEGAIGETKQADMERRGEIMNMPGVDLVVSIHMNKFRDRTVSGPMVFYMKGSEEGKRLAEYVIASVCDYIGRPRRKPNPEDLFVLRVPSAPSVLVECGFLSNAEDEALLMDRAHMEKLAEGIAEGIVKYCESIKENGV